MRILDAFCCQGGAGRGYMDAGYQVTGVDLAARHGSRYPGEFIHADAIEFIREHGHEFDAIHASPPCQRFTHGNAAGNQAEKHPDLIDATRDACESTGRPYILENVPRAPLRTPVLLCGVMFNLDATDDDGTELHLQRHRLFETNWHLWQPPHWHPPGVQWAGAYGGARRDKHEARNIRKGGYVPPVHILQQLLRVDWMTEEGMFECIPPAYSKYVGMQLAHHLAVLA